MKLQTTEFFIKERGLRGHGLNQKLSADMACVIPAKVEEFWGKYPSFKTTNTTLSPQSRADLLQLCSKIYEKGEITNNEFMVWMVKGYIVETMGFDVNWASAAESTNQLLVSPLKGELLRQELTAGKATKFQHLAPHAIAKISSSHSKSSPKTGGFESQLMDVKFNILRFKHTARIVVLAVEVAHAQEVLLIEVKLLV